MNATRHLLRLAAVAAAAIGFATPAFAGPSIDVSFEASDTDSQQLVHAVAEFPVHETAVHAVFDAITDYPELHQWIRATKPVSTESSSHQYLVQFTFPWPVGRQWSRVEVRQVGQTIFWRQVEGTLKANHGSITFTSENGAVHVDYRAAMDIGLPESLTRSYKAKFVSEFLTAARKKAAAIDATPAVVVARGN